ncbi:NUDIX domain-containing protein [Rosistilla oblonga]|uniref:NUDIX domain-containing protein n=1 Tax=Rosistilla oblonga TaxID=2527990 RepID=UPI003A9848A2
MDTNKDRADRRQRTGMGVVGVILREDRFLLIRRSKTVTAPGFVCFAGGGVEAGESEQDALVREMQEELAIDIVPNQRIWESVTRWGTELGWWLIEAAHDLDPVPNPAEVEEIFWLKRSEITPRRDLLGSMPDFLGAWQQGAFKLPIDY